MLCYQQSYSFITVHYVRKHQKNSGFRVDEFSEEQLFKFCRHKHHGAGFDFVFGFADRTVFNFAGCSDAARED